MVALRHCSMGRKVHACSRPRRRPLLRRARARPFAQGCVLGLGPRGEASPTRGIAFVTLVRMPTLWCLRKGAKPPLLSRPGAKLAAHASPALGSTEMHEPADAARSGSSLVSQMQPAPWS